MTKDEAGNRIMVALVNGMQAFLKIAQGPLGDAEAKQRMDGVSAFISNLINELVSRENGKALEILIEDKKSVPKGSRDGIAEWCNAVISGVGGLKDFHKYELGGDRASIYDAAKWVVRCLANPRCAGSGMVIQAILDQRACKLGLSSTDLEERLVRDLG